MKSPLLSDQELMRLSSAVRDAPGPASGAILIRDALKDIPEQTVLEDRATAERAKAASLADRAKGEPST